MPHAPKSHAKTARERRARRAAALARYASTPRGKFRQHKQNAAKRGVPFRLTFEEWVDIWAPYFDARGNKAADQFVMCRRNDEGAYEVGNVEIRTHASNVAERNRLYAESQRRPGFWSEAWETDDYKHVHGGVENESDSREA